MSSKINSISPNDSLTHKIDVELEKEIYALEQGAPLNQHEVSHASEIANQLIDISKTTTRRKLKLWQEMLHVPIRAIDKVFFQTNNNPAWKNAVLAPVKAAVLPVLVIEGAYDLYRKKQPNTAKPRSKVIAKNLVKMAIAAGSVVGGVQLKNMVQNEPVQSISQTQKPPVSQKELAVDMARMGVNTLDETETVLKKQVSVADLKADNINVTRYLGDVHFRPEKIRSLLQGNAMFTYMCRKAHEDPNKAIEHILHNWDDFENHVNSLAKQFDINPMSLFTLIYGEGIFHPGAKEISPRGAHLKGYGYIQLTGRANTNLLTGGRDIAKIPHGELSKLFSNDNQFEAIKKYLAKCPNLQYPWDLKIYIHWGVGKNARALQSRKETQLQAAQKEIESKAKRRPVSALQKDLIIRKRLGDKYADFIMFPEHWDVLKTCIDTEKTHLFYQ